MKRYRTRHRGQAASRRYTGTSRATTGPQPNRLIDSLKQEFHLLAAQPQLVNCGRNWHQTFAASVWETTSSSIALVRGIQIAA